MDLNVDLNKILLIVAALAPAIVLCIFIFVKDRAEKEPLWLLMLLLGLGVLICFPAGTIERVLGEGIDRLFSSSVYEIEGELFMDTFTYRLYHFIDNFIGIALVEEGLKFLAMFLVTRKSKHFNSLFDGLVYAVFVSLGFAAFENILYVLNFGWHTAYMRAIMSVPGHMFFAVMMGYYYSMWHVSEKARTYERELKQAGMIPHNAPEFSGKFYLALSLAVPVCIHGLYDYCCNYGGAVATIALYVLVIALYFYCFRKVIKLSGNDMSDAAFSILMVMRKYPYLVERLRSKTGEQTVEDPSLPL